MNIAVVVVVVRTNTRETLLASSIYQENSCGTTLEKSVLTVKGSLRPLQQRRALDSSGPFCNKPSFSIELVPITPLFWLPFSPLTTLKLPR
jgi:hypothetical protein